MNVTTRFASSTLILAAAIAATTLGCSGANGGPGDPNNDPLPENTGAISARLTNIPADVQCVELQTSDYHTSDVRADVTPGGDATIRIAPLSPGEVYLSGMAYNAPCYAIGYYGGYYGDAGAGSSETWEATPTYVAIEPGQIAETELHFHQLGGADVDVSFDNDDTCDPNASFGYGCDGGPPPPTEDAGVPVPTFDAGMASAPAH